MVLLPINSGNALEIRGFTRIFREISDEPVLPEVEYASLRRKNS